jgi:hypothetical protein
VSRDSNRPLTQPSFPESIQIVPLMGLPNFKDDAAGRDSFNAGAVLYSPIRGFGHIDLGLRGTREGVGTRELAEVASRSADERVTCKVRRGRDA